MQLRKIVAFAADKLGYEAYPKYMSSSRPMAQRLRDLFALCGIERVIDVGGNRGQYRNFLRFNVDFHGPILSVEPDPELVAAMRATAAAEGDASWTVMQCALGRSAGQARFNRMQLSVFNSFLTPHATADRDPRNTIAEQFDVQVRRLDDLLPELGDLSRTFVKSDTQGFDLEVLGGGAAAFAQVPLVQMEVAFQPTYEGSPGWVQSVQAFEAAGYQLSDLFMLQDGVRQGIPHEADCIMIRPRPDAKAL